MMVEENKEWLKNHLIAFQNMISDINIYGSESEKQLGVSPLADRYLDDQISMERGMKEYIDWENEMHRRNLRLLKAIKNIKGKTFAKHLKQFLHDSDRIEGQMEIVRQPEGTFQSENEYGKAIIGIYINQWSTGDSGDSFAGIICIEIKPNRYFKFNYSC